MGLLIEGVWHDDSHDSRQIERGRFVRPQTRYRNWVTPDGGAGTTGEAGFPAERDRYHLATIFM
jgi:putative glutathione S-transferase